MEAAQLPTRQVFSSSHRALSTWSLVQRRRVVAFFIPERLERRKLDGIRFICATEDASYLEFLDAPFDPLRDALLILVSAPLEAFRKPKPLSLQGRRTSQLKVLEKMSMRRSLVIAAQGYC